MRTAAFDRYGTECACCGEDREPFLCIDHIGGGGAKHRREIGVGGSWFYLWLRRNDYPDGYRALCHNCNMALGLYGECPHEAERIVASGKAEVPK